MPKKAAKKTAKKTAHRSDDVEAHVKKAAHKSTKK